MISFFLFTKKKLVMGGTYCGAVVPQKETVASPFSYTRSKNA